MDDSRYELPHPVCRRHPDADYRYASAIAALSYSIAALRRSDREAAAAIVTTVDSAIRRDWEASRLFWQRYDTLVGDAAQRVNDTYLKAQGQEQGIESLVELGAGKVLSGLARRIDRELSATAVGEPADVEAFLKSL